MANFRQKSTINPLLIIIGVIFFIVFTFFVELDPERPKITYTAAIALLMAFWWVGEALPIAITAILPVVLFPFFGIMDGKEVSEVYINYVIFLFIGGFLMALAMEKWDLHRRIALKILSIFGGSPFMIMFGFMFASSFLSMWMSNTATAMMMMPIAFSVIATLEEVHGEGKISSYAAGLLLAIAHACSIGGVSTLVGTPANLSFIRIFEITFPNAPDISFGQWLIFALPISIIVFIYTLFLMYFIYRPKQKVKKLDRSFFKNKYRELGKVTREQISVFILFLVLAFLWVFREGFEFGQFRIPGWSQVLNNPKAINDGTVAILVAIILFIIPSSKKNQALMDWQTALKIPWHIVFLFGGGFALAKGFVDSGLSKYIGEALAGAGNLSTLSLVGIFATVMSLLTEFTSNTATTEMMLPIVSGVAVQIQTNPLLLMIPITLAASMAFMFPIATPPNIIVFGTGKIRMFDMIKTGVTINFFSVIIITIIMLIWGTIVFDIDPAVFPDWAKGVEGFKD